MTEIGARVWAVSHTTDAIVYAYGMGIYLGDRLLPEWNHPATMRRCRDTILKSDANPDRFDYRAFFHKRVEDGKMTRAEADQALADIEAHAAADRARPLEDRVTDLAKALGANPVIKLDAGGYVWGAECWWGEADPGTPERTAKGRRIELVPATTMEEPV
jgi:hypothetical protein